MKRRVSVRLGHLLTAQEVTGAFWYIPVVLNPGRRITPGGFNKFPGEGEPLRAYNMESLINKINLTTNKFVFKAYLKSGVLETNDNHLRTTAVH